jgi:hypothetical protein
MEEVKVRKLYQYDGAVLIFDRIVANRFTAQTMATSEKKARSNIAWQYRKAGNVADHIPVTLTGLIKEIPMTKSINL